jgi:hypothetical protein
VTTTTGPATVSNAEAGRYLTAVESRLAALPAGERAELLEDLANHLEELSAEEGSSLTERIGSPEAYAADLLGSLGMVDATVRPGRRDAMAAAIRNSSAALALQRLWSSRAGHEAGEVWSALRPAWWVARAYLAASGLGAISDGGHFPGFPLPGMFGNIPLGVLAVLVAVPVSVRLGRMPAKGLLRGLLIGGNLALIAYAGFLVPRIATQRIVSIAYPAPYPPRMYGTGNQTCLTNGDGQPITNLYPYTADGKLTQVLLYDQSGHPVDNLCATVDNTGRPLTTQYPQDTNGAAIYNVFPQQQSVQTGISPFQRPAEGPGPQSRAVYPSPITSPVAPPAIVTPQLAATPTPATTPTTTATSTPLPMSSPAG